MNAAELETIYFAGPKGQPLQCPTLSYRMNWTTCKRRGCPRCGIRWAGSWEAVMRENFSEYGGDVGLVSITAPGAELLPWACTRDHQHSGPRGCRVESEVADRWSALAPANWTKLRQAARIACKRRGLVPTLLARVWEPQKRGVPHLHLVLGMGSPAEAEAARAFVDELARLAPEYFFGFVDRHLETIDAREASRYLSGYLLGRSQRKGTIRENIQDARMPHSLLYVARALTQVTLVTMRRLRYARWYFGALRGQSSCAPRITGQLAYEVARVCTRLDPRRRRGDPDDRLFLEHYRNLKAMRQLAAAA